MRLRPTQQWMQHAITGADCVFSANGIVKASASLTAEERVAIYRDMFPLRMEDALASDYPGVQRAMGSEPFARLAARYVAAHPSRSYTLNRLGDHFPAFMRAQTRMRNGQFLSDLAELELAMTLVFDAAETPPMENEDIQRIAPERWPVMRLRAVDALRLVDLSYPAHEYLTAEDATPPPRRRTRLAIYREHYALQQMPLDHAAYTLLKFLVAGTPLGHAVDQTTACCRARLRDTQLFEWFRDWTAAGFFAR
ncbi:MAG: putative DNA-binding domain-containing protein [Bryobacterales bacterium]|nr:putative DNA-binding domain-containing protein [Bryobacterales bacterium]